MGIMSSMDSVPSFNYLVYIDWPMVIGPFGFVCKFDPENSTNISKSSAKIHYKY